MTELPTNAQIKRRAIKIVRDNPDIEACDIYDEVWESLDELSFENRHRAPCAALINHYNDGMGSTERTAGANTMTSSTTITNTYNTVKREALHALGGVFSPLMRPRYAARYRKWYLVGLGPGARCSGGARLRGPTGARSHTGYFQYFLCLIRGTSIHFCYRIVSHVEAFSFPV